MVDLQTIVHNGRLAAVVAGGQAIIRDSVPDRDLSTIKAMCLYALEREIPKLRALAIRRWDDAEQAFAVAPRAKATRIAETEAFWDWAVLELLLQSGLRIEEASELTTLDVLRRRHPDGPTTCCTSSPRNSTAPA